MVRLNKGLIRWAVVRQLKSALVLGNGRADPGLSIGPHHPPTHPPTHLPIHPASDALTHLPMYHNYDHIMSEASVYFAASKSQS